MLSPDSTERLELSVAFIGISIGLFGIIMGFLSQFSQSVLSTESSMMCFLVGVAAGLTIYIILITDQGMGFYNDAVAIIGDISSNYRWLSS
jgi:hypothetical protein